MALNAIFVFGSNLAGRHGKGAAKYAALKYGAQYGVGEGRTGDAYALPTKDENLKTRSLEEIKESLRRFKEYAALNHHELFELTPVGCGLAGYKKHQIFSLLEEVKLPHNVVLSHTWVNHEDN